jgi:hypothetical protein
MLPFVIKIWLSVMLVGLLLFIVPDAKASCSLSIISPYKAVVARVESQAYPEVHFRKILTIKGRVPQNFIVMTYVKEQKQKPYTDGDNLVVPMPVCAGCVPDPELDVDKTYFLTLYPYDNTSKSIYRIPDMQCGDRVFGEVKGLFDPKVFTNALAVYDQPLRMIPFILWLMLTNIPATLQALSHNSLSIVNFLYASLAIITVLFILVCLWIMCKKLLRDLKEKNN